MLSKLGVVLLLFLSVGLGCAYTQTSGSDGDFALALPSHPGRLQWHADAFRIVESSVKPNGQEIGIRGHGGSGHLNFLGFLFTVQEPSPLTSIKCRDSALEMERKGNSSLKVLGSFETGNPGAQQIALVRYTAQGKQATTYMLRGFVAADDICGDLEFYSDSPIAEGDDSLNKIFDSYHLDPRYVPRFGDTFFYGQILYNHHDYKAAAPIFEQALTLLNDDGSPKARTMSRVVTDQSGMAYGMSGDNAKARAIFESAIAKDPDYPLYYYNLACADAADGKLDQARTHLEQAFARKANAIAGETMPDPAKDDSFLPYRNNKDFWKFIEGLH